MAVDYWIIGNCCSVSTLFNLSQLFEKLIYSQINSYMSDKFSKYLAGFCKNHNTKNALLNMTKNWKSHLNKGNKIGAIFMDLAKANGILFAKISTHCNYADNNTQFSCEKKLNQVINNLQTDFRALKV